MKRQLFVFAILILAFGVIGSSGQDLFIPEKGSAERTAILNALRVPVERDLKQKVVFATDSFKVQGAWAFVSGTPQKPDGGAIDYSRSKFASAYKQGAFDDNFFALLKKTGGKWKVTTLAIGCTDVCYADWWRRHKAPKAIFPYTE